MTPIEDREERKTPTSIDGPEEGEAAASTPSTRKDFADFFQVLAASFAYARAGKKPSPDSKLAASRAEAEEKAKRGARSLRLPRWLIPALVVALACFGLVKLTALLTTGGKVTVPDELIGRWTTSAERYRDRGFSISKTELTIETGSGASEATINQITEVGIEHRGEAIIYTLTYMLNGAPYQFAVRRVDGRSPLLRLNNQLEIAWSRDAGPTVPRRD